MLDGNLDEPKPAIRANVTFVASTANIRSCQGTNLFLSVRSAVPGCALRLSAAPPTTMVIEFPGPFFRMFEHDCFETEQMPIARMMSR